MIKVTLDTNILISATFWSGDSFRLLELIDCNKVGSFLSREILSEYVEVLGSEEIVGKIRDKNLIISKIVERVIKDSTIVEPKEKIDIVKDDPDDNKVLECAKEGNVNYIITSDKHLLRIKRLNGIRIIEPREFLKRFNARTT